MGVELHDAFAAELRALARDDRREAVAIERALLVLAAEGPGLGFPWTSAVRGSPGLRELRPRGGRSSHRALFRRRGDHAVVLALAPEAVSNRRGFRRAVEHAERRISEMGYT